MDSMLSSLRSIKLDPLLTMLISAVILAIIVPARGDFADWFSTGTKFAVALLFYLYGARLSTAEAIRGLTHWRLHLMILSCRAAGGEGYGRLMPGNPNDCSNRLRACEEAVNDRTRRSA